MPTFPPEVSANLRYLQQQINRLGTARPGPMSWGPDDGHIRFYDASGNVLFQADATGAAIRQGGSLTGMGPLLEGHTSTLGSHDARITTAQARADYAVSYGETVNGKVNANRADITAAQARADSAWSRAGTGISDAATAQARADYAVSYGETVNDKVNTNIANINTAQARADSAWTRAGTGIANAATAQARADSAHTRIDGLNYASPGDIATLSNQVQALRSQVHDWMQTARASNPSLPPPIPN